MERGKSGQCWARRGDKRCPGLWKAVESPRIFTTAFGRPCPRMAGRARTPTEHSRQRLSTLYIVHCNLDLYSLAIVYSTSTLLSAHRIHRLETLGYVRIHIEPPLRRHRDPCPRGVEHLRIWHSLTQRSPKQTRRPAYQCAHTRSPLPPPSPQSPFPCPRYSDKQSLPTVRSLTLGPQPSSVPTAATSSIGYNHQQHGFLQHGSSDPDPALDCTSKSILGCRPP